MNNGIKTVSGYDAFSSLNKEEKIENIMKKIKIIGKEWKNNPHFVREELRSLRVLLLNSIDK